MKLHMFHYYYHSTFGKIPQPWCKAPNLFKPAIVNCVRRWKLVTCKQCLKKKLS